MSGRPTNVSLLEAKLCERGMGDIEFLGLHPDANDEGHAYYDEVIIAHPCTGDSKLTIDFTDRYSEPNCVRMRTHVDPGKLQVICDVLKNLHKSKKHHIGVDAVVTVPVAVAVCEALRGRGRPSDE